MKNAPFKQHTLRMLSLSLLLAVCAASVAQDHSDEVRVQPEMSFPEDGHWHHYFDTPEGEPGKINPGLGRAAAFLETMQAAGVPVERLAVAVVVHGRPVYDVSDASRYTEQYGEVANPNEEVVVELIAAGARIRVCGVSAKYCKVGNGALLPGVPMAHSAMTANVERQRRGYTLNPY